MYQQDSFTGIRIRALPRIILPLLFSLSLSQPTFVIVATFFAVTSDVAEWIYPKKWIDVIRHDRAQRRLCRRLCRSGKTSGSGRQDICYFEPSRHCARFSNGISGGHDFSK